MDYTEAQRGFIQLQNEFVASLQAVDALRLQAGGEIKSRIKQVRDRQYGKELRAATDRNERARSRLFAFTRNIPYGTFTPEEDHKLALLVHKGLWDAGTRRWKWDMDYSLGVPKEVWKIDPDSYQYPHLDGGGEPVMVDEGDDDDDEGGDGGEPVMVDEGDDGPRVIRTEHVRSIAPRRAGPRRVLPPRAQQDEVYVVQADMPRTRHPLSPRRR